ncbi:extracellular solute-binding protein [Paenibacillus sp. LHD-38]|uniref:extracellular solute-binding protein n=1 Tax=Paenibacillus sp. LHD-38 TaxID=3072143 RepID=UPI00280E1D60|nr:extracellular solute-binding protein [Paenibacillus sp. LHD-38]MDQ8737152.1 extracellular solute-binding protein [Paenibacillus sp. LHD-38]
MKKQFLVLFVTLALVLSACGNTGTSGTGETPKDNAEEKVTFKGFGVKAPAATTDWNDMPFLQQFEDNVNIDIEWTNATTQTYQEQVNLMFASNDLPDLFFSAWTMGSNDIVKYGANGQLIPLESLIEEHAPNIKAFFEKMPEIKQMITASDGHIYALPQYDGSKAGRSNDAFFINKGWLDQLNLEIPKTTEEFKAVLKAFKGQDLNGNGKNDEIPFSFMYNNDIRGPHSLSGSFGVVGRNIGVEDGKVYYAPTRPEYKEYVKFMHELYAEGLIDVEAFTHDVQVYDSKVKSSTPILGAYFNWSNFAMFGKSETDYAAIEPLKGPNGDQMWNRNFGTFSASGFSITNANKNPERTIKWVDQMFEPETGIQISLGPFGENLTKEADSTISIVNAPEGVGYEEFRHKTTPGSYGVFANLEETLNKVTKSDGQKEKEKYAEMYAPYQPEEIYPNVMYSAEDAERLSILQTDIDGYIKEMIPKFMIQGKADEGWDAYVDQLNKMGYDELMGIYQKYYDNFK